MAATLRPQDAPPSHPTSTLGQSEWLCRPSFGAGQVCARPEWSRSWAQGGIVGADVGTLGGGTCSAAHAGPYREHHPQRVPPPG